MAHPKNYPLMAVVGATLSFTAYKSYVFMTENPDVHLDPVARTKGLRDEEEAKHWKERVRSHSRRGKDGVDVEHVSALNPVEGVQALTAPREDDVVKE